MRASVRTQLDALLGQVRITPVGLITMTSRRQKIPVTVANNLDQAVTVRVRLEPLNAARLKVTQPDPVTIEPQHKTTVEIAVEATISGQFRAEAWLETVGGIRSPTAPGSRSSSTPPPTAPSRSPSPGVPSPCCSSRWAFG